jgi:glycosyltransferase involved in cell wall biosynthesis
VRFTFAGKWLDGSVEELRARAGDNVEFTGWLSDEDLHAAYRRAAVYVQASRHEGFGLAVAEAMLAGCVPVVMNVTAMPEVVGDAGVLIESQEPEAVAEGVRRALDLGPDAARRARERILTAFPMERRHDGILGVVEDALHG